MKSFYEIMRTPWWDLDSYELKYYVLGLFVLCELLSFVNSILIVSLINDFSFLFVTFGSFSFSALILLLFIYKRDYLDEKYVLFDDEFLGISYQGIVIFLIAASAIFSSGVCVLAFKQGGLYSAIAFGSIEFLPPIFMFLRLGVYSNDNRTRYLPFGYNPLYYYMLSLMVCNGPLGVSLLWVFKSIFENTQSLNYSLFCFVLAFCLFCFVLSPDKVNKILPFELRSQNGFKKFAYLSLFLAAALLLLMMH